MGLMGLKSRCEQGCVLSRDSRGGSICFLALPTSRDCPDSLAHGPSWLQSQQLHHSDPCFCCHIFSASGPLASFSLSFKRTLVITFGPITWVIQNPLHLKVLELIVSAVFPLLRNRTYSQVPEDYAGGHLWRVIVLPSTQPPCGCEVVSHCGFDFYFPHS